MRVYVLLFVLCSCFVVPEVLFCQPHQVQIRTLISQADDLASSGKYRDALLLYEKALQREPENQGALYNAGLSYFLIHKFVKAKLNWERLEQLQPNDWMVKAKLIQTYQALNDLPNRDREHSDLIRLHEHAIGDDLAQAETFCREQAEINGRKVMVLEHFAMKGDRSIRYEFIVLNEEGKEDYYLSLGSYDLTNSIWARENPEKSKKGIRLFHLDGYYKWGHATYSFFEGEPSYDDVRKLAIKIIEDKSKPLSTSVVNDKK